MPVASACTTVRRTNPGRRRLRNRRHPGPARTVLRQLARLTRPIPSAGPGALAVAVNADGSDETVAARESGVRRGWRAWTTRHVCWGCCAGSVGPRPVAADRSLGSRRARVRAVDAGARRTMGELRLRLGWQPLTIIGPDLLHRPELLACASAVAPLARARFAFGDRVRLNSPSSAGLEHLVSVEAPSDVRALHLEVCLLFDRPRGSQRPGARGAPVGPNQDSRPASATDL